MVYHDLAVMLDAGVPMVRSLNTTTANLKGKLQRGFAAVIRAVSSGEGTMTEEMGKHPKVFSRVDVLVLEAAETSGKLVAALKELSGWHEFRERLKMIIISKMTLPIVVVHIAAAISPMPAVFFAKTSVVGGILQGMGILGLFYVPAAIIFAIAYLTPRGGVCRRRLDAATLRIPLLGIAVQRLGISRYCKTFNMLYTAGVPISRCAEHAPKTTGNVIVGGWFQGGAASVAAGGPVSDGFSEKVPSDFVNLWRVGEESGELDNTIKRLAENTSESAQQMFNEFGAWFARAIYALVCILLVIQILQMAGTIGMR